MEDLSQRPNVLQYPYELWSTGFDRKHPSSELALNPWYGCLQADFLQHISYRRHQMSEKEKHVLLGHVGDFVPEDDLVTAEEKLLKVLGDA
ncbi:hypothetical protein INT43_004965 [Umbelopsis isabellina]|uniref:Uncharacterized protein n=1 Tax=Mortierella isabellina TaxID=91625 RepID=A0A8H7PEI3_MORIS|nr:hypothetical protein INT43_004965 [Umbelopsis isabellina]